MIVTSKKTITFPGLKWGIAKGEEKELPKDKKVAEAILAHQAISEVGEKPDSQNTATKNKTESENQTNDK